jgi:hypothetical protein
MLSISSDKLSQYDIDLLVPNFLSKTPNLPLAKVLPTLLSQASRLPHLF